jgi:hypothetical protein
MPRGVAFDSLHVDAGEYDLRLVGREGPFRALRTHECALGFDSTDLVLEAVVRIEPVPLASLSSLNDRIRRTPTSGSPAAPGTTPDVVESPTRECVADDEAPFRISPRCERLVRAGTHAAAGLRIRHRGGRAEEAAIASVGLGGYLTVTGSTARDHGLASARRCSRARQCS